MKTNNTIYILFILIQSLVYGIGNPLTKTAYESITPLWLLTTRFIIAFSVMLLIFGKRIIPQVKRVKWTLWLPSGLCCAGAYISCNIALELTTATNVGFVMSLPVLFAPLLATLVLKKPYDFKRLPLQLLTIVGLFLLCCNDGSFSFGLGELLALFDALCLAGLLVFSERAMAEMDTLSITAMQIGTTMVLSTIGAVLFDSVSVLPGIQPNAWFVILYLALICTILAYALQNSAVAHLSSAAVSMLQCSQPILTAFMSYLILRETLSVLGLLGAAIIVACLLADSLITHRASRFKLNEKEGYVTK